MKICPYCQQDAVWRVNLISKPEHIFFMCFECDSVWLDNQIISDKTGTNFRDFMQLCELVPDWNDIKKIEMVP
jgi:Zn-finger nucleic acid-binding protein